MASRRPLGELVIEVGLDSASFNNSLKGLTNELKIATNGMKANVAILEAAGDQYGALGAKVEGLNHMMDVNDRKIAELQRQHQAAIETYGAESEQVQKLSAQINNSIRQQAAWQKQLQRTGDQIEKMAREMAEAESKTIKFGQNLQDAGEKANAMADKVNKTLTPAIAGIGIAATKVATDTDSAFVKMQNSMDLTVEQTEALKGKARGLYTDGYGQSMSDVTTAITQVRNNMRGLNEEDLSFVTKSAMNLANTFDADTNEVTRAANNIMKNFGVTSEEAFDMLAKGAKQGLNFSNELFDNMSEYAPLWSDLGFSAEEMFGTLVSGAEQGVYNLDYLNDMVKEFGIRLFDGSKSTSDAMKVLFSPENFYDFAENLKKYGQSSEEYLEVSAKMGKDYADEVVKALKQGGKVGQDAWDGLEFNMGRGRELIDGISDGSISGQKAMAEISKAIADVEDPIERTSLGVALFGTKFEDIGTDASIAMLTAGKSLEDFDGTMSEVNKNVEESFGQQFQKTFNMAKESLQPLGETMLDLAQVALPAVQEGTEFINKTFDGMSDGAKKTTLVIGGGIVAFGLLAKAVAPVINITGSLIKKIGRNRIALDAETLALIANTRAQQANADARNRNGGGGAGGNSGSGNNRNNGNGSGGNGNNRNNNDDNNRNGNNGNNGNNNNRDDGTRNNNGGDDDAGNGSNKFKGLGKLAKIGGAAGLALGAWTIFDAFKTEGDNKAAAIGGATGSVAGGVGGATIGAAIGTAIAPGLGTAIGGVIGGIVSSVAGDAIGKKIGNSIDKNKADDKANKVIEKGATLNLDVKGVSKGTQEAMNAFEKLRTQSQQKLDSIYNANRVITSKLATDMTNKYNQIATTTIKSVEDKQKKEREIAVQALNSNKKLSEQERQQALADLDKKHAAERDKVTKANERIAQILSNAKSSKRALTAQEKAEIEKLTNQMNNAKIKSTAKSEKESTAILRAQKNQRNSVRTQELNQVITNANKQYKAVVTRAKKEEAEVVESAKKKYRKKVEQAKMQYETLGTISKQEYDKLVKDARKEKDETIKHAEEKRKKKIAKAKDQKEQVSDQAEKERDKVVKAAKDERKKAVKEAEKQASGVASTWSGLSSVLDKMIGWAKKLFGNDSSNPSVPKIDTNIKSAVSAYAKGTYNGRHRGGTALVGEEGRELAHIPGVGMTMLGTGGPQLLDLPRGTAVLPHAKTEATMRSYGFPAYAKGTGDDSWFGKVTASLKDGVAYLGDKAVDAFEWATDSGDKLFDKMASAFGISTSVGTSIDKTLIGATPYEYVKDMASDFLKSLADSLGGYYDYDGSLEKDPMKVGAGGGRKGLMLYVDNILKDIQSKFKVTGFGGFSDRNIVGGNSKSMHAFGRAIDIFSSKSEMQKIADYVKKHPLSQYTIYNRKYSKNGGGWKPYMTSPGRNPHVDHVHADFLPPTSGAVGGGGAGVQQWKAVAIQALKRTGDYSEANLNALLRRMQQESTGNARSINLWDSNAKKGTPSKGLMQVIDPTFAAYRDKSLSKDIYNPLANIVAAIKYTKARYGSLIGGWGRKGGYANGGLVQRHQIAEIAEGNKPEMIIPLDRAKRGRALQLLAKAQKYLGVEGNNDSSTVSSTGNSKVISMMAEQISLLNQQVALLAQIVTKDTAIVVDGREIAKAVNKINKIDERRTARVKGVTS